MKVYIVVSAATRHYQAVFRKEEWAHDYIEENEMKSEWEVWMETI
jgi:hypothetical protein